MLGIFRPLGGGLFRRKPAAPVPPYSGLGPGIVLGFRRLVADYAGPCCTVSVLGVSYDVGFDADGDADWAALRAALPPEATALDVRLMLWHDQSGAGNHVPALSLAASPRLFSYVGPTGKVRCAAYINYGANPQDQGYPPDGPSQALHNFALATPVPAEVSFSFVGQGDFNNANFSTVNHRVMTLAAADPFQGTLRLGSSPSGFSPPFEYFQTAGYRFPGASVALGTIDQPTEPYDFSYRSRLTPSPLQEHWHDNNPAEYYTDTRTFTTFTGTQFALGYFITQESVAQWIGWVFEFGMVATLPDASQAVLRQNVRDYHRTPWPVKHTPILF